MRKKVFLISIFFLFALSILSAGKVKAIINAHIIPVSSPPIEKGIILIEDGKIKAVGENLSIPPEAEVIDLKGLYVYPGMIDAYSRLGLMEIASIPVTVDFREAGQFKPHVNTCIAVYPYSEHIPIALANGILAALAAPAGGWISGKSCLIQLYGKNIFEMDIKNPVALHIEFPERGRRRGSQKEKKEAKLNLKPLEEFFEKARLYLKAKEAAQKDPSVKTPPFDEKLEAMIPVLKGKLPVIISANKEGSILAAIKFAKKHRLKAILYGVKNGWKVADKIAASGYPVILAPLYTSPDRWEDGYDAPYRNAGVLAKAGVKIAFSTASASAAMDLPFHAAKAVAFGLDKETALKAVTLYPAEILGVADRLGSIEPGKLANLVVTDGDLLEIRTHIKFVFIKGKKIKPDNKFIREYLKYRK